jgi:hypothetical protein
VFFCDIVYLLKETLKNIINVLDFNIPTLVYMTNTQKYYMCCILFSDGENFDSVGA